MKKTILVGICSVILILMFSKCYASSNLSVSNTSVTVGSTFKVTANVNDVASWQLYVNVTGPAKLKSGETSDGAGDTGTGKNGSRTLVSTYEVTGEGNITISFSGNTSGITTDGNIVKESINATKTVVGKAKTTTTTSSNTTSNSNTSSSNTTTSTTTKSSDAKIKALTVDVEGLNPSFKKDVTSYKLKVGNDVNKLSITLTLDDNGATYRITGNKNFKDGENVVKVIVTAENKTTTKTYKITVTKIPNLKLSSLNISNAEFVNEFDPDVYEYNLKDVESNIEKLDIKAIPASENTTVQIAGNDSLVTGDNVIKIVVADKGGEASKVYTLKVNKLAEAVETISDNTDAVEQNKYVDMLKHKMDVYKDKFGICCKIIKAKLTIILLYLLALFEFFQVIYLYRQLKAVNPDYDKIVIKRKNKDEKNNTTRRKVNIDIDIDDKK